MVGRERLAHLLTPLRVDDGDLPWTLDGRAMPRARAGETITDALLRAGVVDEVNLTICPLLIGGKSAPTIADGLGMERLAAAKKFELKSKKQVKDELFLVYRAVNRRAKT